MAQIIWSPRAVKDINEIAEYIAKDSFQYAAIQTKLFISKVNTLEKYPFLRRSVPELKTDSLRQVLCGHYRIIYEILPGSVIAILTIHHQSRLLKNNPTYRSRLRKKRK